MYLTIGNIPKEICKKTSRRAQILLAYLPTTHLQHITSATSWRRALANLFHACMHHVLAALREAGISGIDMAIGDENVHCCHSIFAIFVGDYPEQVLVTCLKNGECLTCPIPQENLGSGEVQEPRDLAAILEALDSADSHPTDFAQACLNAGIKPIYYPFWENLPYVNIFHSITLDILHQLYQGLIKHLVSWLTSLLVFGKTEIDAWCQRMPPNHNLCLFSKGITGLSQVSEQEYRDMCRILLGLIIDLCLPHGLFTSKLVRCVRSLLDFLYLA